MELGKKLEYRVYDLGYNGFNYIGMLKKSETNISYKFGF